MVPSAPLLLFLKLTVLRYALAGLTITEQPSNASVYAGHTHTLNCIFNESVNCAWTREKIIVTIENRYRYTSNNGVNTTQCSLEITKFTAIDAATWQCKNKVVPTHAPVMSHMAFLSIELAEEMVAILLNGTSISMLVVSNDNTPWTSLVCVATSKEPIQNLQWELDGRVVPSGNFSSKCRNDASQYCNATLTWSGGWKPLANSSILSCSSEDSNHTSTVALYNSSNTTKIIFFSLLAAATGLLFVIVVTSLYACIRCTCTCSDPCSDPYPGLFRSVDELDHRCDSVARVPHHPMAQASLHSQKALYSESCKSWRTASAGYLLMPDQCSRCSDAETSLRSPSYLELTPYHTCNCPCHPDVVKVGYCTGNCNSHGCGNEQPAYICFPPPADVSSAARHQESEELHSDSQSTAVANGPADSKLQVEIESIGTRNVCDAPSFSELLVADQHSSQESLYNDCIPSRRLWSLSTPCLGQTTAVGAGISEV